MKRPIIVDLLGIGSLAFVLAGCVAVILYQLVMLVQGE